MKKDNGRILVLVEREEQEILPITFELLQAGKELAGQLGSNLCSVVLGNEMDHLSKGISQYTEQVDKRVIGISE
jgi:electron transfer flavoprotein alpha subunit